MIALLAVIPSFLWGTADFLGGRLSRHANSYQIAVAAQLATCFLLFPLLILTGSFPHWSGSMGWAALAGVCTAIGQVSLYRGLATGPMGVVASIVALGVMIPVMLGISRGEQISVFQTGGIVLGIAGAALASGPVFRRSRNTRKSRNKPRTYRPIVGQHGDDDGGYLGASTGYLGFALCAALGFGSSYVAMAQIGPTNIFSTLFTMQISGLFILSVTLIMTGNRLTLSPHLIPAVIVLGSIAVTSSGIYTVVSRFGQISVVSVLSALYPAVTALLAWKIGQERLQRWQIVGVASAVSGVILLAAG